MATVCTVLLAVALCSPCAFAQVVSGTSLLCIGRTCEPDFNGDRDVSCMLYTQNNPSTPEYIVQSDPSKSPSFNPANPTRFIIHGWISCCDQMDIIRKGYIDTGKSWNIVVCDWSKPAACDYITCKNNTKKVGVYLAGLINYLVTNRGLSLDNLCLIGHSLGAHIAGVVGYLLGGRVAGICGLDPAWPLYFDTCLEDRLDTSDAKCVQVIHTNGGELGWKEPLGHSDFYVNGGSCQAGCEGDITGACSHNRCPLYFAESLYYQLGDGFVGCQCDNFLDYVLGKCSGNNHVSMGEWTICSAIGTYFLKTNCKSPYALGNIGL